ncbi:MAG: hypothetical protein AB2L11_12460 [Syntrophobacteraceae bacterium]
MDLIEPYQPVQLVAFDLEAIFGVRNARRRPKPDLNAVKMFQDAAPLAVNASVTFVAYDEIEITG